MAGLALDSWVRAKLDSFDPNREAVSCCENVAKWFTRPLAWAAVSPAASPSSAGVLTWATFSGLATALTLAVVLPLACMFPFSARLVQFLLFHANRDLDFALAGRTLP